MQLPHRTLNLPTHFYPHLNSEKIVFLQKDLEFQKNILPKS